MEISLFWRLLNCGRAYGEQECKKIGFDSNSTNAKICLYLLAHPGVSQYDIAFAYHMEASTVAKALSRLEREGLVSRTVNQRDKRERIVSLTEAGRETYSIILAIQNRWAQGISDCLTAEENAEFDRLCRKALVGARKLLLPGKE